MAEAFLKLLLDNISSLIRRDIGLIMGVDNDMKKLSSTLTTIQAVLEDAEEKQLENKAIQNWLCKLSDLTYEIDDILDECTTEVAKLEHKNSKMSRYNLKNILYRHKIGRRMKEVTVKLDVVAAEREKFHLREMVVERHNAVAAIRETGSILDYSHPVYGRDEEKEKIVDILVHQVSEFQQLSILSIIGIGGLGKTTLAQLVVNDDRVLGHFDTILWVFVADNFDLKTLIKEMIESASGIGSTSGLVNLDTLQRHLRDLLNQKRYLLVLDDVWNEDQNKWSSLKRILACGSKGTSIIVTTRLKKVSDIMSTVTANYLTGLSEKDCWLLLRQRAFGHEEEEHPNLQTIGKHIAKKCAGVPLAAKTLGGLLRFKREEIEWLHVKESEMWNLPQEETSILPALRLSYHHLPLGLRQCFAYCSVFPKDTHIDKKEVIFLWMAHGYISSNGILEVEDVGNEIWNELALRCLFQDVITIYDGQTIFRMHDLVHDLAQSIMENKVPGTQWGSNSSGSNSKIRQVHLYQHHVAFPSKVLLNMDMSSTLMTFSRLRTLNASRTSIKDLPSELGNLKHLRYLNLSHTQICSLPKTICSLWNLKILDLSGCRKLVCLPKNMRYMRNLRHLFLDECNSLSQMPPKIGELTYLKTLRMFIVGHGRGNQLGELESLSLGGKLDIRHLERVRNHMDAEKANLAKKQNLRDLSLQWEGDNVFGLGENMDEKVLEVLEPHPNIENLSICGFKGNNFPIWMRSSTLENIVRISIQKCPNCLFLPQGLGDLPFLKYLGLEELALQYIIQDGGQGVNSPRPKFPRLQQVSLNSLPNLEGLLKEESEEMFPNLHSLTIRGCSSLILPKLPSLKTLYSYGCSNTTMTSFSKLENLVSFFVEIDKNMTHIPKETLENRIYLKTMNIWGLHEHSLPDEALQGLKSLKCFEVIESETLTCLPESWLTTLTSLVTLHVTNCPEFVEFSEEIKCLKSLKSLKLGDLPKMICLPEALQQLSSLQSLSIYDLPRLTLLPHWLGKLTNLDGLFINNCPNIPSLPIIMQKMTSLKSFSIRRCPELERRCEKGKGEDWHKIAHIDHLDIGDNLYSRTRQPIL